MSARDVISGLVPEVPDADFGARKLIEARRVLTAAGYDIVGPGELHKATVDRTFILGDRVTKINGSSWTGRVVGFYSTKLTPLGYCVESENEPGSVQIYPESAIRSLASTDKPHKDGWQPIETAPKDGTPIFAYRENTGWEYFVVKWIDDRFFTLDSDCNPFSPVFGPPTHWVPLPTPPRSLASKEDGL